MRAREVAVASTESVVQYPGSVIPILLAAGVIGGLFGLRGLWFVIVAALAWPVALAVSGVGSEFALLAGGSALAAANAAVSVAFGHAVRRMVSSVRTHA